MNVMRSLTVVAVTAALVAVFGPNQGVLADDASAYLEDGASVDDFIQALKPQPMFRTRGIQRRPDPNADPETMPQTAATQAQPEQLSPAASVRIEFGFDSAELTPDGMATLDNLAAALNSDDLGAFKFVIEGHTDAVGSDSYNQSLSEKRALSVQNYLISRHAVDHVRLVTVGKGESELYDSADPASGANRRVKIINLGG